MTRAFVLAPDYPAYRAWRDAKGYGPRDPGTPCYAGRGDALRGCSDVRLIWLPYYDEHPDFPAIREMVAILREAGFIAGDEYPGWRKHGCLSR